MVKQPAWLLDTNILSEGIKPVPDAGVMANLQRQAHELAIPAPVWHELRFGWLRMPEGRRCCPMMNQRRASMPNCVISN